MDPLELAWQQFLADPDAAGAFAEQAVPVVEAELPADRFDPLLAQAAADEAVFDLLRHSHRFDPARGITLLAYLVMAARRDLQNLQQKEGRHQRKRNRADGVELEIAARNDEQNAETFADHPEFQPVIDGLSPADRAVFELMKDGRRATDEFAALLGLTDHPPDEQAKLVKQAKDRIMARFRRAKGDS